MHFCFSGIKQRLRSKPAKGKPPHIGSGDQPQTTSSDDISSELEDGNLLENSPRRGTFAERLKEALERQEQEESKSPDEEDLPPR